MSVHPLARHIAPVITIALTAALTGCSQKPTPPPTYQKVEQNPYAPQYIKDNQAQQNERLRNTGQALAAKAKAYERQSKR